MKGPGSRVAPLAGVSVDLDEIPNYFGIHGLPVPDGPEATLVYDVAIERLTGLAADLGVPLTLFAVGSDLARPGAASRLAAAHAAGCEVGNHTLDHRYDLVRLGRDEIRRQVVEGAGAIERATGERPCGFRAPGYTITDEVFDVLGEVGVEYDASVFPCPAYYAAKTAKIGLIALQGRTSRSIVDNPAVLTAPTRPYRVGRPYHTKGRGVFELPVQVTRIARLPFIGTFVTNWGPAVATRLARGCIGEPFANLELHGIDVLDASDGLEALRGHQPDVRVSTRTKIEAIRAAVHELRDAGHRFVTHREAARTLASDALS
ncbi:MAG: polysaccharide deacetylase family protein [Polyangiaceae bacterium]